MNVQISIVFEFDGIQWLYIYICRCFDTDCKSETVTWERNSGNGWESHMWLCWGMLPLHNGSALRYTMSMYTYYCMYIITKTQWEIGFLPCLRCWGWRPWCPSWWGSSSSMVHQHISDTCGDEYMITFPIYQSPDIDSFLCYDMPQL